MQGPPGQKTTQRYVSRSTCKAERLPRGALSYLPDKSIVIKVKQCGCRDHAGKDPFHCVHPQMGIEKTERAVGKDQAYIEAYKRAATSKHEAHESADVAVLFDAVPVVDPDKREVLHVVENLKQRNADENVRDEIIAIPP